MDLLIGLTALILICIAIAVVIRVILVWIAHMHGYTAEEMPKHYHIIGVCAYFTAFWTMIIVLYMLVGHV